MDLNFDEPMSVSVRARQYGAEAGLGENRVCEPEDSV